MCWKTKLSTRAEAKIAYSPVKVFKVCKKTDEHILSYYFSQEYEVGKTYRLDNGLKFNTDDYLSNRTYHIYQGFHSYSPEKIKIRQVKHGMVDVKTKEGVVLDYYDFENIVRVDCIIPEGSVYYENENGEFVSDIIRIDSIEQI